MSIETQELTPKEVELKNDFTALLEKFSGALLEKLMANERKYGFGNSWKIPDWEQHLQRDLLQHVQKGDPRDVAIYGLFAWYHGWSTASPTRTIDKLANLEVIQLATINGVPMATLAFQDLANAKDITGGNGHIDVPLHFREIQRSAYGNVLVDQSVRPEPVAVAVPSAPSMVPNENSFIGYSPASLNT